LRSLTPQDDGWLCPIFVIPDGPKGRSGTQLPCDSVCIEIVGSRLSCIALGRDDKLSVLDAVLHEQLFHFLDQLLFLHRELSLRLLFQVVVAFGRLSGERRAGG